MIRNIVKVGIAAGMFMATVVTPAVVGTPAQADIAQCGSNLMCFWHDQGFGGRFFSLTASDAHLGSHSDEAHSVYNRTGVAWVLYDDENFRDTHWCIPPGVRNRDIGASPYRFGDKITSARRLGVRTCESYRNVISNSP